MGTLFDTLEYARELKAVGIPDTHAEAHAKALSRLAGDSLVTKEHFDYAMEKRDAKLTLEMEKLENRLIQEMEKRDAKLMQEMEKLDNKFTHEMEKLDSKFTHEMEKMQYQLTVRLGGMIAVGISVLAVLVKIL